MFISVAELVVKEAELSRGEFQKKTLCQACGAWSKTSCALRHHQRRHHAGGAMLKSLAVLLPPRRPAMELKTPSSERAPKAVERSDSTVGATFNPPPPPLSEEPARELSCADFWCGHALGRVWLVGVCSSVGSPLPASTTTLPSLKRVRTPVVVVVVVVRELLFLVMSVIRVRIRGRGSEVITTPYHMSFRFSSETAFWPKWIRSSISTLFVT